VVDGDRVAFGVELVSKAEMPDFQWQKDGVNIAHIQGFKGDLVIDKVSASDAGSYSVVVTYSKSGDCSAQRSAISAPAMLTVNPKPLPFVSQ